MKLKGFIIALFAGVVLLYSCEQKSKANKSKEETHLEDASKINEKESFSQLELKVEEIEGLCANDLIENKSLMWEKANTDSPEFIQITSFIDQTGAPYKIIEEYKSIVIDDAGNEGRHIYYLDDGQLFAYYHQYDRWSDSMNAMLFDEQHFIDEKTNEPFYARQRSSDAIEYLNDAEWKTIRPSFPDLKRYEAVINHLTPFQTHFLSFVETDYALFLVLGEPKEANEPRFQTAVVANPKEPFVQDLLKNKEKYKFRKMEITFTTDGGGNSPVFSILQSAKWVD